MFCNNCGTQYEVTPIDIGKSKFCRNCGNIIYKNENGNIIFSTVLHQQNNAELERLKQEELLKQRQLEIQQKQQVELERQKQEEVLKEQQLRFQLQKNEEYERQRQLEIEQKQQAEIERKRQEELLRQRQLEIENQKAAELEKKRQDEFIQQQFELDKQKVAEFEKQRQDAILEQRIKAQKQHEDELEIQRQKEITEKENNRLELEKAELYLRDQEKKERAAQNNISEENIETTKKSKALYFIIPILLIGILAALAYFIFPEKIKTFFDSSPIAADSTTTTETPINTKTTSNDTILIEQLKADLIGKEVLSWNAIKANEINELTISSVSEADKNSSYIVTLKLDDKAGTKAIAELVINYTKIILTSVETKKITYKNLAPANAWFSFEPVSNCSIFVNTNNNPIQIKSCENCVAVKMNTNAETQQKLATQPTSIYISSDTKYESEVDFTYIPNK